jgi:very-short-patch-repair endonuclease
MQAGWGDLSASEIEMVSTAIRRAAAKKLRSNTTPHERIFWRALKELPIEGTHFRRQAPIGPYVVDFFCPAKKLIIELDGGHMAGAAGIQGHSLLEFGDFQRTQCGDGEDLR